MEILRVPPYPISVSYTVPSATTSYFFVVESNDRNEELLSVAVTSSATSVVTRTLSSDFSEYDENYAVTIYVKNGSWRCCS